MADAQIILAQSGADAIMIGRAHYGAPWLAGHLATSLAGEATPGMPKNQDELCDYVCAHYEDMLALYGQEKGLRHARKHLGWYLDRHAAQTAPTIRQQVMTGTEPQAVRALMREALLFDSQTGTKAAA